MALPGREISVGWALFQWDGRIGRRIFILGTLFWMMTNAAVLAFVTGYWLLFMGMKDGSGFSVLRRAIASSLTVRLGYGEGEGLVDPMRLQAGMLTAVDRITGEVRSFAVSRIVAAAIELNLDAIGILWPAAIAPWQVAVCPVVCSLLEAITAARSAIGI